MRRPDGAELRIFNGIAGEWLGTLSYTGKKDGTVSLIRQIRPPAPRPLKLHLVFALIKKDRMDFLIEKAVELGVTDLHPILTQYTTLRDLNEIRVQKQVIEAAEQCERLDLPELHPLLALKELEKSWPEDVPLLAALEREDAPFIGTLSVSSETGLLIGPEGGFSGEERQALMAKPWIRPVGLGKQILRSETAGIFGLSVLSANFRK